MTKPLSERSEKMKLSTATGGQPLDPHAEKANYMRIREAGFRYVNYDFPNYSVNAPRGMDYMGDEWKQVAARHLELMKSSGLTPVMAHGPYCYPMPPEACTSFTAACIRTIECCGEMGIPHIVMHPDARQGMSYDEFLTENREYFRSLIPAAEKTGVTVLIENIGQFCDPHYVHDGAELKRMIEAVEHPLFAACWDTGHANHIMDDQTESLRTLGPLLKGLHVNDNLGDLQPKRKHYMIDMHTLPLFGTADYDGVIRTLKEIGYTGYFNFETAMPRSHPFKEGDRLAEIMPELKKHTMKLLYETGRLMLTAYDCYEE